MKSMSKTSMVYNRALYLCHPELELEKLDIFAELELRKVKLENFNSDLPKKAELELELE